MDSALRAIHENVVHATDSTKESVSAHPIHSALSALGILILISPWRIEALGFAE